MPTVDHSRTPERRGLDEESLELPRLTFTEHERTALRLCVAELNERYNRYYDTLPNTAKDGAVDWIGLAAGAIERMLTATENPERPVNALLTPVERQSNETAQTPHGR